jgi:DNA repair protein RadA/Sms
VTMEGTRPLLVEVQALASPPASPAAAHGQRRGLQPAAAADAVLSKRVGFRLNDQDVFVNVVGGLRISEPAADLAVALAIASSLKNCRCRPTWPWWARWA